MKDKLSGTLETGDPDEHCSENRKVNNYDWPSSRMVVEARGSGTRLVVVRVAFFPKVLWGEVWMRVSVIWNFGYPDVRKNAWARIGKGSFGDWRL